MEMDRSMDGWMDMGGWMDGFLWVDNRWMNGWMVEEPLSSLASSMNVQWLDLSLAE
jgi:hypothetical protein